MGDARELLGEKIFSPRPEGDALPFSPGKTPVAIELDLVEPVLAFQQLVDQSRINRLDERDLCSGLRGFIRLPAMGELTAKLTRDNNDTSQIS